MKNKEEKQVKNDSLIFRNHSNMMIHNAVY